MKETAFSDRPSVRSDLLTADEVGRLLRLPLSTVYYLAKSGKLPAVRFGRSWRFLRANIERLRGETPFHRVLVIDDDAVARGLVSSALESCDCRVWEAECVEAALQLCLRQRFDILFVDQKMPGRNGIELIRELLGEYSLNQMVVITAHPDISEIADLLELGPIKLLRKPLSVAQLIECVKYIAGTSGVAASSEGRAANRGADESTDQATGPGLKQPEISLVR
jgi:excisionase family DNA binding protein